MADDTLDHLDLAIKHLRAARVSAESEANRAALLTAEGAAQEAWDLLKVGVAEARTPEQIEALDELLERTDDEEFIPLDDPDHGSPDNVG